MVGAIHGRLLTAWSVAGVVGPLLISYIRDYQIEHGVSGAQIYNVTMYLLAGLLAGGLLCNLAVSAVDARHHLPDTPSDAISDAPTATPSKSAATTLPATGGALVAAAWLVVWIPIGWGVWVTLQKAVLLFQ
jgi:hypothetical protein